MFKPQMNDVSTFNPVLNHPPLEETPTGGDVPDESGFSPFPGNINVLLFNLPAYARCLQQTGGVVPEFVNPKWANSEKTKLKSSTRLESMMQDFPRLCQPGDWVLLRRGSAYSEVDFVVTPFQPFSECVWMFLPGEHWAICSV